MELNTNSLKPIFVQLAEWIEDQIINGAFSENAQIPSINQFALEFNINPATANKGFSILVDNGIIYKKRGIGMFVCDGATAIIRKKRTESFTNEYLTAMIEEAKKLNIDKQELIKIIDNIME